MQSRDRRGDRHGRGTDGLVRAILALRILALQADGHIRRGGAARVKRLLLTLALALAAVAASPALATAAGPAGPTAIAFDGRVELNWQPTAGASAYTVYRGLKAINGQFLTHNLSGLGPLDTNGVDSSAAFAGRTHPSRSSRTSAPHTIGS